MREEGLREAGELREGDFVSRCDQNVWRFAFGRR